MITILAVAITILAGALIGYGIWRIFARVANGITGFFGGHG